MIKKITLLLVLFLSGISLQAQYSFGTIAGPIVVQEGSPVTLNINDAANSAGVPTSATGSYSSFQVTLDWSEVSGFPYSEEAQLTATTAAGSVFFATATSGGASSNSSTTLTFEGTFFGPYDPSVDGTLDLEFNQTYSGSSANWANILVTIYESPTCIDPNTFAATIISSTSVQLDWNDPTGFQNDFEYVIQAEGTGTPTGSGTPVSGFSVTDNSLTPNTAYEAYVRADCGGGDYSSWVGPITFTTPTEIVCGTPSNIVYCYDDNDTTTWSFISSDGSPLRITFNGGDIESCCDDILIYQGSDNTGTLLYQGNNGGDLTGLTFDSASGLIYVEIDSDGSVSCVDGSFTTQWDFTVICATCVSPNSFTATALSPTSAQLDWNDPTGFQNDFEYVIQPQGTGIPTANGTAVSSFSVTDNSLTSNTAYEAYVRADCGSGNYSSWVGPVTFRTPAQIICGTPLNTVYCYDNNDTTTWVFISDDGSPLRITFNGGDIESCCDDILIYDGTDNTGALLYQGNNGGDLTGLTFDSTSDAIYVEIDSDGSVSCGDASFSTQWDFTVTCATCVNPTAIFAVIPDCNNTQFSVDVDLTDLGTATSVSITDGTTTLTAISATGVQTFGPYAEGASLSFLITNEQDGSCTLSSGTITYTCPPANDECANATVLTPGGVFADNAVIGYNTAATDSGETAPGCALYLGGDVWYTVTVPASGSITIETNNDSANGSSVTDTGMAVYSGSCGSLTLIECDDDDSADGNFSLVALTGQTPGEVLYVSVWEYANDTEGSFQVSAYDASLSAASFGNNTFKAYPNPVKDILNLEYSSDITAVRVMNLLGQEVLVQKANAASTQVDMTSLAAGTYIVSVQVGDNTNTLKVVKQ
ncbi:T9SS type A sorting domain-containing protein [Flavobacterium sediminis]|nr:T9SS type A sorting domain-containing protein [Flavobacterium sediminis]